MASGQPSGTTGRALPNSTFDSSQLYLTTRTYAAHGAEEFQALDFSKMDLSEYYSDIEARAQSDIQVDIKDKVDAYMQTINP